MDDVRLEHMEKKIDEIVWVLKGKDQKLGLVAKVNIIWHSWVWILCSASATIGWIANVIVQKLMN